MDMLTLDWSGLKYTLLLAVTAYLCITYYLKSKRRKLPPGPRGVPVLGYLPFLSTQQSSLQLEEFRKKYGNVFGMYLGQKFALFLGDLETSKEAYNMDEFSARPEGAFPISKKSTHFAAISGQPWKDRRRLSVKGMRHIGIGTEMIQNASRSLMSSTVERIERVLHQYPGGSCDVDVRPFLTHATISVVLNFVCGKTFPPEHESYRTVERFLRFFADCGAGLAVDIYLPWAKPLLNLLSSSRKRATKIFDEMEDFTRSEIESHIRNRPDTPKDLLDYYIQQYDAKGKDLPIDDISGDAQVMIFAGADTVRGTTEWFLLCMAQYPEIQERVFREIDDALGPTADVRYEDREKVPYTEAAILESMRYRTLVPLNPYHSSTKDMKFHGYDIPEGSLVFALLWSIHNDPKLWSKPEEFYPEHFLTADGSKVKVPEAFQPFAPGKRTCMGDKAALIETFLFCVTMVRHFQILPPTTGLNTKGNMRLNMEPESPIVRLVKRL